MNLMSNENITWTVERERGISFDLTALYDMEVKCDASLDMTREIKLEAESGVKDTTFGHPFGQCRPTPQPRPPSPSPFGLPKPKKHGVAPSCDSRGTKQRWGAPPGKPAPPLARTRSQAARANPPKPASTTRPSSVATRVKAENGGVPTRAPRRRQAAGVDTSALKAELGLVDSRHRCARRNKGTVHRVGAYTLEERAALVAKFHSKRGRRIWRKKIKYDCRKKLADKRPRLKGRFVTQEELDGLDKETLAKVTGLGPYPTDSSSSDAEDSDSSEGYSGPSPSRYRGGRYGGVGGKEKQRPCQVKTPSARRGLRSRAPNSSDSMFDEGVEVCAKRPKLDSEPEEEKGVVDGVSSSFRVAEMFAVRTEADVEDEDEDETVVKVEGYDAGDVVSDFMVDDILSSNFNLVSTRDLVSTGISVK